MSRIKRVYFKTEEVVKRTKTSWIDIETDFVQLYQNAWRYLIQMKRGVSKDFLLWILQRIDENNCFNFSASVVAAFNSDINSITPGESYSSQAIEYGIKEMMQIGVIRRVERGKYQVNPRIFWMGDANERMKAIGLLDKQEEKKVQVEGAPVRAIEAAEQGDVVPHPEVIIAEDTGVSKMEEIHHNFEKAVFLGEKKVNGTVPPVNGVGMDAELTKENWDKVQKEDEDRFEI